MAHVRQTEGAVAHSVPQPNAGQRDVLEDFFQRMPIRRAATTMGVDARAIRGAIERGELAYVRIPGQTQRTVTPAAIAEWVTTYCTHRDQPVSSG